VFIFYDNTHNLKNSGVSFVLFLRYKNKIGFLTRELFVEKCRDTQFSQTIKKYKMLTKLRIEILGLKTEIRNSEEQQQNIKILVWILEIHEEIFGLRLEILFGCNKNASMKNMFFNGVDLIGVLI